MHVQQRTNNKASSGIMHKEWTKTFTRYRTKSNKNTTRQRQTQRIPTSCKKDGKETKGRRISIQKQKRGKQIRTMNSRFLVGWSPTPKALELDYRSAQLAGGLAWAHRVPTPDIQDVEPAAGVFLQGKRQLHKLNYPEQKQKAITNLDREI